MATGLLAGSPAAQQPPRPTFRTSVEYVEVDARVVDGKGTVVRNLRKEDFRLFEDGNEQIIDSFFAVDIPVETVEAGRPGSPARVAPDVNSNAPDAESQSRVYLILLDDRQIDPFRTQDTIRIVKQFIQRNLGAHDLAAIVSTSGRTDVSQAFTNNKPLLLRAVEGFMGRKYEPSMWPSPFPDAADPERFHEARSALQAIRSVADWMANVHGRSKALVLVSEGLNYNYDNVVADPNAALILEEERDTIAAVTRANVTIYPIDPRGLGHDDFGAIPETRADMERSQMSLRSIARDTGGEVAVNTNNFTAAMDRVVTQNSTYYLLGYHPKNTRRDGKFRKIQVKVNRSGLRVITRGGYGEPSDTEAAVPVLPGPTGTSREVREALNSPMPMGDLPLSASAIAFRANDGKAAIAVVMESPAASITFSERDGKFTGAVEIITAAVDQRNAIAAQQVNQINFGLSPETFDRMQRQGFRTLSRLNDVRPGRYQVRVALAATGSSRRGSVWYDLEVPDFSKGELAMSGLLVGSVAQALTPTGNPDKLFAGALPIPPTTVRQFRAGDELMAFAEVYNNQSPHGPVDIYLVVAAEDGSVVLRRADGASAEHFTEGHGAYGFAIRVPLTGLAPGSYVLSMEARGEAGGSPRGAVTHSVPFRIVP